MNNTSLTLTWDYNGLANNVNFFGTQKDWNNTLMAKLNTLCGGFMQEYGRRPNFIGGGPEVISVIEDQTSFYYTVPDIAFEEDQHKDVIHIGSLKNRYSVWESMDMAGKPYLYMGFISKNDLEKVNEIGLQKYAVMNNFPTMEFSNFEFHR